LFEGENKKPPVNLVPFIIVFFVMVIGIFFVAQTSWVGQLMHRGPVQEDPLAKLTFSEARQIVESKITEGVAQVGGTATFKWTRAGADADKASEGPVEVNVEVALKDANDRKAIMEPVKEYFEKAQIQSLTMTDPKLHATWTYNLSPASANTGSDVQPQE
jgi:hypothetical protein